MYKTINKVNKHLNNSKPIQKLQDDNKAKHIK